MNALEQILQRNFEGSVSHRRGGSFSTSLAGLGAVSETIGFLIPCPPLINSRGASWGMPNFCCRI